jgi:hypothetical protein
MKMTQNDFFKREHWSLKVLYVIGLVAFIIHLMDYFNESIEYKILSVIAYGSMTIFFLRLAFILRREKSK